MTKFSMKLFEVITEEGEKVWPAEAFRQILKEIKGKRSNIEFLPVQKEIFGQLAANLILHLSTSEEILPIGESKSSSIFSHQMAKSKLTLIFYPNKSCD